MPELPTLPYEIFDVNNKVASSSVLIREKDYRRNRILGRPWLATIFLDEIRRILETGNRQPVFLRLDATI
jgi:hypothetical protein